jgi:hypothetical protein
VDINVEQFVAEEPTPTRSLASNPKIQVLIEREILGTQLIAGWLTLPLRGVLLLAASFRADSPRGE